MNEKELIIKLKNRVIRQEYKLKRLAIDVAENKRKYNAIIAYLGFLNSIISEDRISKSLGGDISESAEVSISYKEDIEMPNSENLKITSENRNKR